MNQIVLYTTGCPKCLILEKKLKDKNVNYEVCNDVDIMRDAGITSVPVLEICGKQLSFYDAVKYVNGL